MSDVTRFVQGTSNPAFAVNGAGEIIAWNPGSEIALGIPAESAVGMPCCRLIRGRDEGGKICSGECLVRRRANAGRTIRDFDIKIRVRSRWRWFGVTPVVVNVDRFQDPVVVHILQANDVRKRLELLVRDYLVGETELEDRQAAELLASTRSVARDSDLTRRESQILGLIAQGKTSRTIGMELGISTATVNNHTQKILRKLNSHTRLEAVHRAERAGLIRAR